MLASTLLALLAPPTGDPPVSTFTSSSGAWVLTVTRPEKTWNGDVELVLTHDGVEAWRARHELGLREACVGDDGRVAGYGYTGEGRAESWWSYDMDTGAALPRVRPKLSLEQEGRLLGAAGVPATPLALLHWTSTSRGSRPG